MKFHRLAGGSAPFPIIQLAPGDPRLGDGTNYPIGFTFAELLYLIWKVKSWVPTFSGTDALGNNLNGDWWKQGIGTLDLPSDILPNNQIWGQQSLTSALWGSSALTTLPHDLRENYCASLGTGLSGLISWMIPGTPPKTIDAFSFFLFQLPKLEFIFVPAIGTSTNFNSLQRGTPIFYDGTLYYPGIWLRDNQGGSPAYSINASEIPSGVSVGTLTVKGKTCDIYGLAAGSSVNFTLTVNAEW